MDQRPEAPAAYWPRRLVHLCAGLRRGGEARQALRAEAWLLLRDALARYLRVYAPRFPLVAADDLEDLASAKALELLTRAESGEWDPEGRHPAEVAGYVAAVARNGLARVAGRIARAPVSLDASMDLEEGHERAVAAAGPEPVAAAEAREFVEALRCCVEKLQPRARRVWFYRAFFGLSSREIAEHPDVGLRAPHVDVIVQRTREALRTCMDARGLGSRDYPAGVFAAMWQWLSSLEIELTDPVAPPEEDHGT